MPQSCKYRPFSPTPRLPPLVILGVVLVGLCTGCETSGWAYKLEQAFSSKPQTTSADEEKYRRKYMANHDREALYWLLRHRVQSGMSYTDVCNVLGEEGTPEARDNWIKANGGSYYVGDDCYGFGPDTSGQTLYLVFRDKKLVNFDPTEFSASARPRAHSDD